ncbi:MAG: DUF2752 domain-containing protein [Nitriliruptorales bacterium]|nr:DUF2752 domain-containing protein [Nitriliruptorales bacterium]
MAAIPLLRSRYPLLAPLSAAAMGLATVGALLVIDPNEAGHYPTCPFLAATGLQCPGCGTLRAIHALLHGDPVAAVGFNVLSVAMLPVLLWAWGGWTRSSLRGRPRAPTIPAPVVFAFVAVVVAFWVLRNTPAFAYLAP